MRSFITFTLHYIIRVIKLRRMRWAGHVSCMGGMRSAYRILVGKPAGKRALGRPRCVGGRIILEWILEKQGGKVWTGFTWLGITTSNVGSCEHGDVPLGSVKAGNFLTS